MELSKLFMMQRELDAYIQKNGGIKKNVFREKGLALIVELAELANETRSFKFWSTKGPSDRHVILEEYVDSIHFLLSLGIEKEYTDLTQWPEGEVEGDLTALFLKTTEAITYFLNTLTKEAYIDVWIHYGTIAQKLGFTYENIVEAYVEKNDENYKRQKSGY